MATCTVCKKCDEQDQLWACDQCQAKICTNCSKITASEIKCMELRKGRILKFFCKACDTSGLNKEIVTEMKKLKKVINEQTSKIDRLTTELLALTEKFEKLEENNMKQNTNIERTVTEIKNNTANGKLSYSNIVAGSSSSGKTINIDKPDSVLIVKPKEAQSSQKTKKEIKEKVDPSKLGAGVSGMKEISNGQILIRCDNKADREKIQNKIQEEMSTQYDTKTPTLKCPKVKIVGINKDDDDTDKGLIEAIIDQNLINNQHKEAGFHLRILKKLENKDKRHFSLILEADPKTYYYLLNQSKIFIGWSRGKVYDYVHIIRCYKCLGFNHFAKDCQRNKVCYKCSLVHEGECEATTYKCINCRNAIDKYKIKIADDHNALDPNCPCYVRILNSVKRKIGYSENE